MFRQFSKSTARRAALNLYPRSIGASEAINVHTHSLLRDRFKIEDEEEFRVKVMESSLPVIVNFHAEWCEPCHNLRPLLEKIVADNEGKIHLAEILVEENASLLSAFEVTAVPAVIAIHKGEVMDKFIGLVDGKQIKSFVKKLLSDS